MTRNSELGRRIVREVEELFARDRVITEWVPQEDAALQQCKAGKPSDPFFYGFNSRRSCVRMSKVLV